MKNIYLILAIIGFLLPNYFAVLESIETGNILLYTDPVHTFNSMFANRISMIFSLDLIWVVLVFFVWSFQESKKYRIKGVGYFWLASMAFGLSGPFPLFLYFREQKILQSQMA